MRRFPRVAFNLYLIAQDRVYHALALVAAIDHLSPWSSCFAPCPRR